MPSSTESESIEDFGIVFLEANYFKRPIIGTYSDGIREAIIHRETGLSVKEKDTDELKEKILFMYNKREICKNKGIMGYERVIKEFNWNIIVDEYIKVFKELIE